MVPTPPRDTYWVPVGDGAVLAGPHPVLATEGLDDRIKVLVEHVGVKRFLDLSSAEDWMPGYRELLPGDVEYVRYEIIDRWLPPDPELLRQILREVIDDARAGRITYIHCQAGLGRTGTVVGCLLRELGADGEAALDQLVDLRLQARLHEGSPEFEEQRDFVRRWRVLVDVQPFGTT